MDERGITVIRQASGPDAWETASALPHPQLRGHVLDYTGYREDTAQPLRRREAPWAGVTLIISFGEPIALRASPAARPGQTFTSFVAGLWDTAVLTEHAGRQHGVEVRLTPLGAHALLGLPMHQVANTAVGLDDLLGPQAARLTERLAEAADWAARFALLDQALAARIARGPAPSPEVAWAWRRLWETAGRVTVGGLTDEVGWSRRHLVLRFREQIGLPPKAVARVLRFQHALHLADGPRRLPWSQIALASGYYDQAHLNRDFRTLAGCTPTQYLAERLPAGPGTGQGDVAPAL